MKHPDDMTPDEIAVLLDLIWEVSRPVEPLPIDHPLTGIERVWAAGTDTTGWETSR